MDGGVIGSKYLTIGQGGKRNTDDAVLSAFHRSTYGRFRFIITAAAPEERRFQPDRLCSVPDEAKPPVFLLDAMSFIFRAYHAMQRSRPMSTRSGLPTAATYVFVNMIKKLRQDFSPRYFAAVFDVSGEVFRDERARSIGMLRKWN